MDCPHLIRNVAIAGHLHHGKVSLCCCFGWRFLDRPIRFDCELTCLSCVGFFPEKFPFQTCFVDCLIEQTHPDFYRKEDGDVSKDLAWYISTYRHSYCFRAATRTHCIRKSKEASASRRCQCPSCCRTLVASRFWSTFSILRVSSNRKPLLKSFMKYCPFQVMWTSATK